MTMSKTPKKKFKDTKLGKELTTLRDQLKPMSWKQRIDHIWTYYKEYILVFGVFAMVLVGLITSAISGAKDPKITGILVNLSMEQKGMNYIAEDYVEYMGLKDEDMVRIGYTYFEDPMVVVTDENYYASQTVINQVSAQMLDYMILDQMAVEYYSRWEVYMDLRDVFTEEELLKFAEEDRLIYCLDSEMADHVEKLTEEEVRALQLQCLQEGSDINYYWPGAVKITDTAFVKDCVVGSNNTYFAVAGNTTKIDQIRDFWQYLNQYKAK